MRTWMTAIQIRDEQVGEFLGVSAPFANACLAEAGLVSFALLQQINAKGCFSLFEVYHDDTAWEAHRSSQHFGTWQAAIKPMLEMALTPQPYTPIFPPPEDWERHLEA